MPCFRILTWLDPQAWPLDPYSYYLVLVRPTWWCWNPRCKNRWTADVSPNFSHPCPLYYVLSVSRMFTNQLSNIKMQQVWDWLRPRFWTWASSCTATLKNSSCSSMKNYSLHRSPAVSNCWTMPWIGRAASGAATRRGGIWWEGMQSRLYWYQRGPKMEDFTKTIGRFKLLSGKLSFDIENC